jgi:RES domain-containing protein
VALVYRLIKTKYAATAFDGYGAKTLGGRWNSKGVAVVYASESIALAGFELLVHLHSVDVLGAYTLFTLEVPDSGIMVLAPDVLPAGWQADPSPVSTAEIGDSWVTEGGSVALAVPSTMVPEESNIILNPAHPDFDAILRSAKSRPFAYDPRIKK